MAEMVFAVSGKSGRARCSPTKAMSGINTTHEIKLPATMIAATR